MVGGLSNMAFNSALYSKLGYDPRKDFVPVALVYKFGYVMVARKDLPQATLQDIVAAAKAGPGSITVATAGVGTGQHLVAAAFMKAAGIKLLEVPYKGSPPAFTDLLAGRVDLFFDSIAAGLPYVQSGQARGIAVLSSKRSPLAPDVPTMSEAGVPGLDVDSWLGIFAPAKTPPEAIAKLRREIRAALPDLKERFEKSGGEVVGPAGRQARWFCRVRIRELDETDPRDRHQAGLRRLRAPEQRSACASRGEAGTCGAVRCRAGAATNAGAWYGPGSAKQREERCIAPGTRTSLYFTRSINSIAPAGARTLPSWMT